MRKELTVAEYLSQMIDIAGKMGKTQAEIAKEAGFGKANFVSMIKKGVAPMPIEKVPAMARALGIDPRQLMLLVLKENKKHSAVYEVFSEVLGAPTSENEMNLIHALRHFLGTVPRCDEELIEKIVKTIADDHSIALTAPVCEANDVKSQNDAA